jgi:hypothetical protein
VQSHASRWEFDVYLDGRRIGEHTFAVEQIGDERYVTSVARFDVKVLLVPVFTYRHEAREQWRGDCLQTLESTTRINGKHYRVQGAREEEAFTLDVAVDDASEHRTLPACVSTYAYWDLGTLARHGFLLNVQTGAYDPVQLQRLPTRAELTGESFAIQLDYDDGRWQGLSTVRDGRDLEYRLRSTTLADAR